MESEVSNNRPGHEITFQDWGLIGYQEALLRQNELVDLVSHELARETLVFCNHPPVVTVGRGTQAGDIFSWQGEVVEISRGGRATYHGPSQLVVYPILDLNLRGRDLHKFFRQIEQAIIESVGEYGIAALGRSLQKQDDFEIEATGVWVGSKKIASIGIGVRKWVSFHGFALNVDYDPDAFQGLKPCGFDSSTMISMQEILGLAVDRTPLTETLKNKLFKIFSNRLNEPVDLAPKH